MRALQRVGRSGPLVVLGVAVAYFAAAKLGLALAFHAPQVSAVWPPTGLALAAVLRLRWPAAAGVLLGAFAANATAEEPLAVAAGIALGNTLEALVGAALLRGAGFRLGLARPRDVLALLVAATLSPVVSATIGVASLGAGGVHPASDLPLLWRVWWLGDALGDLVVAPLFLVWGSGARLRPARRAGAAEATLLGVGLLAASGLVFRHTPPGALSEYAVFPFLIWGALRFGPPGAAFVTAGAYAIATWGTVAGLGPFSEGPELGLVLLQVFMAVVAATGLLLAAEAEQQRAAQESAQAAERRKDDFLAMLAHELRNPLAPILHANELLGREGPPELAATARATIRRQTEHLARIVDDLLDVARISRGALHLERQRTTLGEAVAAAVETWRGAIERHHQTLTVELPERPLWVEADPVRLAQVLSNLLHNASKFTPNGGSIQIAATEEGGSVTVHVRDSGAGMTPEVLAAAFEPFAQGPRPLDRAQGGLGLGLTLVRQLVELHGGSVTATSAGPGRGSEVVVTLPAAPAVEEEAAAAEQAAPTPAVERRRVLVVDDNNDACESLALLLHLDGHEVRTAADGREALAAAEIFHPDVILLDLGLPELDGYTVARTLRQRPDFARTRIVAISGYGQPEDRARSTESGIDQHLLKPVEPARIRELLR